MGGLFISIRIPAFLLPSSRFTISFDVKMACDVDEITYATGAPFKIMVESRSQSLGQGQSTKEHFEKISSDISPT